VSNSDCHWRVAAGHARQVLILEPLFEEANRTRQMLSSVMRSLDAAAVGSTIPSLSGTGESLTAIGSVTIADWQREVAQLVSERSFALVCSIRGGALLDQWAGSLPRWRFAPETSARIVRDLRRTRSSGNSQLYAGHALTDEFLAGVEALAPVDASPLRTVRLATDAAACDAQVEGTPLWRRAEPGDDPALSAALAHDILEWLNTCAPR
jgi:hypothetical protein